MLQQISISELYRYLDRIPKKKKKSKVRKKKYICRIIISVFINCNWHKQKPWHPCLCQLQSIYLGILFSLSQCTYFLQRACSTVVQLFISRYRHEHKSKFHIHIICIILLYKSSNNFIVKSVGILIFMLSRHQHCFHSTNCHTVFFFCQIIKFNFF